MTTPRAWILALTLLGSAAAVTATPPTATPPITVRPPSLVTPGPAAGALNLPPTRMTRPFLAPLLREGGARASVAKKKGKVVAPKPGRKVVTGPAGKATTTGPNHGGTVITVVKEPTP